MDEKIIGLVKKYWRKELSQTEFVGFIQNEIGESKQAVVDLIQQVILNKNSDDLEYALVILYAIEKENEMIDLIHQLLLKPWHRTYEELAHDLQRRKNPTSIPFLKISNSTKVSLLSIL